MTTAYVDVIKNLAPPLLISSFIDTAASRHTNRYILIKRAADYACYSFLSHHFKNMPSIIKVGISFFTSTVITTWGRTSTTSFESLKQRWKEITIGSFVIDGIETGLHLLTNSYFKGDTLFPILIRLFK